MMLRAVAGAAALLSTLAAPASAALMTFTGVPPEGEISVWVEDGITATSNGGWAVGYFELEDAIHLDDGNTGFASSITFTMLGRLDATSVDFFPLPNEYCSDAGCNQPYDNIGLIGVRDGIAVARDAMYSGLSPFTYLFDSAFTNLDSLVIHALFPNLREIGGDCSTLPCGHFDIDNVRLSTTELAPVPLPAPLLLLLAGLAALGLVGRFKANYRPWRLWNTP